jgi:hypothetical protein
VEEKHWLYPEICNQVLRSSGVEISVLRQAGDVLGKGLERCSHCRLVSCGVRRGGATVEERAQNGSRGRIHDVRLVCSDATWVAMGEGDVRGVSRSSTRGRLAERSGDPG